MAEIKLIKLTKYQRLNLHFPHLFSFCCCSYAFSNRLAVAILRLPNGLDLSIDVDVDTTPPNGLSTPSNSYTNFNHLENGLSSGNLRKDLLQSAQNQNGGPAATIMHADSYLNIYKIPASTTATTTRMYKGKKNILKSPSNFQK